MSRVLVLLVLACSLACFLACSDDSGAIIAEDTSADTVLLDTTPDLMLDATPDGTADTSADATDTQPNLDATPTDTNVPPTDTSDTTLGLNGTTCSVTADCDSGFCYDNGGTMLCSECAVTADCGLLRACRFDNPAGFAVCVGTGALGDTCQDTNQCAPSTFCNAAVCSECANDGDCGAGGACVADATSGYSMCSGGLGDSCTADGDCGLGFCFDRNGTLICSECKVAADCGLQRTCAWDGQAGYAACEGTGALGAACQDTNQCEPGSVCNTGVCSECGTDGDCANGGLCVDDTASGTFLCAGGLGDSCGADADCTSTHCFDNNGNMICSECKIPVDCGISQDCVYRGGATGYALCVGTGPLGAACTSDEQCRPNLTCNGGACSQCTSDADCTNGTCASDANIGAFVCKAGLGENCNNDGSCSSNFCYAAQGPDICSLCASDADCSAGTCDYGWGDPYARCIGQGGLGDACTAGSDCASGFCNGSVCSECAAALDCGDGGACVDDANAGYFVCEAGYGAFCTNDADCASGFCFDTGFGGRFCSQCVVDQDCANNLVCDFTLATGYAECVGTGAVGDACTANTDCASGNCTASVCLGELGDQCAGSSDCVSGMCYNAAIAQMCSLCETNADCNGAGNCFFRAGRGFAACN